jgi:hypothetical protein
MANADLKVVKVFTQEGKQLGYEVMRADGSIIKVGRDQMVQAVSLGHSYSNATVSASGVVRVSSDVPREDINVNKKPTKSNMISHSFNLGSDITIKLQVAKDSRDKIPCKAKHRVIQRYIEDFLDRQDIENLGFSHSCRFLENFDKYYYKNRKKPKGHVIMYFSHDIDIDERPSFWNKFYIIEFDCASISNKLEYKALGRYIIVTVYNTLLKIIKEENLPYEAYEDYLYSFPAMCCNPEISYVNFEGLNSSDGFSFPFEIVGASVSRRGDLVCMDKKTYKDFYKICTEMEKLKK